MTLLYNLTEVKQKRRGLRKNQPAPETLVWNTIRNRQISDFKFKRQFSIGHFIVDFYCPELKLAIEIDGDSRYVQEAIIKDRERQDYLEKFGIKFLRFTNLDVMTNLEGVIETVQRSIHDLKPHPSPLLSKERGLI